MKKTIVQSCADAGSKYCPCHLAYSGDCIRCNMVNGNNKCNCLWQGTCIYNEVQHNKNSPVNLRQEYLCKIENVKEIQTNTFLVKIKIPSSISKELCNPGTYILIKSKDRSSDVFNTPISVMDIDTENNILEVVIKARGIKTKTIINFDEVYVKGPYYNGIFGIKEIKSTSNSNCLIILNGLSQVNSINIIKRLRENKNKVDIFINRNGIVIEDVVKKIIDLGGNIYNVDIVEDRSFISDYIKRNNIELVYSGGGNDFNKEIMNIVNMIDEELKLSVSNNNLICCGEGICGACAININGQKLKTCKSQIDSRDFLNTL
ncbi:2Fe-2S iron-sulfur cluster-binding protein [Romboutsia sp.]|uniref:2Fe-2S iron-sulfur cluster-binding protein n=1 Tax=Romboutsia sp. TaxID=1965302 RepID=UPI003F310D86